ncbi:hypothetical protein L9F63_005896, partial [Diploptera punctata]
WVNHRTTGPPVNLHHRTTGKFRSTDHRLAPPGHRFRTTAPPDHRTTGPPHHRTSAPPDHRTTGPPHHRTTDKSTPPNQRTSEPADHRTTGPPHHRTTDKSTPPDHRTTGPPHHRTTVPLVYRTTGPPDHRTTGQPDHRTTGPPDHRPRVILALTYIYFQQVFSYWKKKGVPTLKPIISFGDFLKSVIPNYNPLYMFQGFYDAFDGEKYGGLYSFSKPTLIVKNPELIKTILVKDFDSFHSRGIKVTSEKIDPLAGHLFSLSGSKWRNLRVKLTPTFTSGKMRMMFPTLVETGKELKEYLKKPAGHKEVIEIKDILARYSTDIIASSAFGIECNSLTFPKLTDYIRIGGIPKDVSLYFREMVKDTVEYREKNNVHRNDFMQLLIQLKNKTLVAVEEDPLLKMPTVDSNGLKSNVPFEITMNVIAAQAFVFFLAGFETSSTTMTFCLYELACNPDIQARLRKEIDTVLAKNNGELTYEAVHEMVYLDKVVNETLRKCPPVIVLRRECAQTIQLRDTDLVVDKGTQIFLPVYSLHHDPKYFPDPEKFDPERFNEEEVNKRPHFAYLPFGEGPRLCIGMRFGLMQTKVGLISILSNYKVQVSEKTQIPLKYDPKSLVLAPLGGMWLKIVNRSVILALTYVYFQQAFSYWRKRGVPTLNPIIPFGDFFKSLIPNYNPLYMFQGFYDAFEGEKYGGLYSFSKPSLMLREPELIKTILVKDFDSFYSRGLKTTSEKIEPLAGHLFALSGPKWRNLRVKLTPTFTSGKMRMMFPTLVETGKELKEYLKKPAGHKEVIEIKDILARYSTDIIASCAFGIECNCLKNPDAEFRNWGRRIFQSNLKNRILHYIRIGGVPKDVSLYFREMVKDTVEFREKNKLHRNDFMQLLIQLKNKTLGAVEDDPLLKMPTVESNGLKSNEPFEITMDVIAAQAFVFFLAGFETSSTTMTFCLYEMACNPDIQTRLRKEIDSMLAKNNGELTYEAIHEMAYLDKVINETLRKYPPVTVLTRECTQTIKLRDTDLVVDKGTQIFLPIYALHHDPKYYPDPDKFDPERFDEEEVNKRPHFAYLPFGEGPRLCIGVFGLMQTKVGLISLLSNYEVQVSEKTPIPLNYDPKAVVLAPLGGMWLKIYLYTKFGDSRGSWIKYLSSIFICYKFAIGYDPSEFYITIPLPTFYMSGNETPFNVSSSDSVILALTYVYFQQVFSYWKKKGVPTLKPVIPFGDFFKSVIPNYNPLYMFQGFYDAFDGEKYGGLYSFSKPSLMVREPELIKTILVKDFDSFHSRGIKVTSEKIEPLTGHLFLLSGPKWRNLRVKLTPTFTSGKMRMMFPTLVETGKELKEYLKKPAGHKEVIEIKDILARYSTDIIASCAFGIECNCLKNPDAEFRNWGRRIFQTNLKNRILRIIALTFPKLTDYIRVGGVPKDVSLYFRKMVKDTVEYREKNNLHRNDFMQLLIQMKNRTLGAVEDDPLLKMPTVESNGLKSNVPFEITMDVMAAQAFVFFLAGFETSSTTMTFCLYEMACNPDIQTRLRKEIDSMLAKNNGELTYEAVHDMAYLDKVVNETLRKYPPVTVLTRECTQTIKLRDTDLVVDKGTQIFLPIYALHHDPKYYPNPEKFDPERFNEEEVNKRPHFAYLPFGEGPRLCIGMRFGLMQTKVGLISLLSNYEVQVSEKTPIPLNYDPKAVVLAPLGGMWLKIVNRIRRLERIVDQKISGLLTLRMLDTVSGETYLSSIFICCFHSKRHFGLRTIPELSKIMKNVIGLTAVILALTYVYFLEAFSYWKKKGVPTLKPIIPFGDFFKSVMPNSNPLYMFQDFYDAFEGKKYGGLYAFTKPSLIVKDPELIKNILVKDFDSFYSRGLKTVSEKIEPLAGHLFLLSGPKWRNLRMKLTPTFTSGKMRMMFPTLVETGKELKKCLKTHAEHKEVIEIKDILARYSTDIIASCAFGIECNCLKNPDAEFRNWGRRIFETNLQRRIIRIIALTFPKLTDFIRIRKMVKDTVEYREKNDVHRNDFMQLMIQLKNKTLGAVEEDPLLKMPTVDSNDLKSNIPFAAQAFVFFLAGFETSSTTMTFCLYELACNPDIQARLRKEIDSMLAKNNGQLTYEAIHEMAYLDKVINETLRKYPPVTVLTRECTQTIKLRDTDLVVDKGTQIFLPIYALHHDPKYYPDPEKFDPERFNEEEVNKRPHFAYLPFGEGPRLCIGMRFGLMQTKVGLITILSNYEVQVSEKTPIPLKYDAQALVLAPLGGMWLKIVNRSDT